MRQDRRVRVRSGFQQLFDHRGMPWSEQKQSGVAPSRLADCRLAPARLTGRRFGIVPAGRPMQCRSAVGLRERSGRLSFRANCATSIVVLMHGGIGNLTIGGRGSRDGRQKDNQASVAAFRPADWLPPGAPREAQRQARRLPLRIRRSRHQSANGPVLSPMLSFRMPNIRSVVSSRLAVVPAGLHVERPPLCWPMAPPINIWRT